jgi:hypothetical protein
VGLKLLDVLFNRGPYEERRRRLFRGTITANAIFLFVTLSIVVDFGLRSKLARHGETPAVWPRGQTIFATIWFSSESLLHSPLSY